MAALEKVQTGGAPAAIGPYSQAIAHGGLVFTAGQIPLDPASMQMVEGDIAAQTDQVLANLREALAAGGAGPEHVVKWNVLVVEG